MAQSKTEKLVKKKAVLFHAIANDAWTVMRYQQALNEFTKLVKKNTHKRLHVRIADDQSDSRPKFEKLDFSADPELLASLVVAKRNEFREYVRLSAEKIGLMENLTDADLDLLAKIDRAWDENQFEDIMNLVDDAYPSNQWHYRGSNM
jgi:hypothetical protein